MNSSQTINNKPLIISPIALFTYKRLDTLIEVIENLQACSLASKSELYIFSDGAKKVEDRYAVENVRKYLKNIKGFKKIHLKLSENNKGLATSIIKGVSEVFENNEHVIVLEDDLIPSTNFLVYMNQALNIYKNTDHVFSVSGYTIPIKNKVKYAYDTYFTLRGSSWGWGTWKNRWEEVDWEVSDYEDFLQNSQQKREFNRMGSDLTNMLSKQMNGEISSWAVRWCYHQFKIQSYTAFPIVSKITNIGFGANATHTSEDNDRFATPLDTTGKQNFNFNPAPGLDPFFIKQFISKYSLPTRAYYKIKKILKF